VQQRVVRDHVLIDEPLREVATLDYASAVIEYVFAAAAAKYICAVSKLHTTTA
jgi:hypothetical protein